MTQDTAKPDRHTPATLPSISALAEISAAIAHGPLNPEELAEVAYIESARLIETDFFQLGVFENQVYRTLIHIRDGDRQPNLHFELDPEHEGIVGWVRRTNEPLLVRDFAAQADELPAVPSYIADDPPSSGLFVPLAVSNAVVGVFAIQSRRPNAFDESHLKLAQVLAALISIALSRIGLHGRLEDLSVQSVLLSEVTRLLISLRPITERLTRLARLICTTLNLESVEIYEHKENGAGLLASSNPSAEPGQPMPSHILRCFEDRRTTLAHVDQPEREEASAAGLIDVAMPMMVAKHLRGVMRAVYQVETGRPDDTLPLLETLAAQAGFALHEAQTYQRQQEEAWITTVLLEVARHAARPGATEHSLQAVLQLATLLAGTRWALLLLPAGDGETLIAGPSSGFRRMEKMRFTDLRVSSATLRLRPPYKESDTPSLLELPPEMRAALGVSEALALTLTDGQVLLGLLLLERQDLPPRRAALLGGIAHQLSLRLENTRLVEEAAARRSLERELAVARELQASFLPLEKPAVEGWEVGAAWRVAHDVGGDFYDFFPLPPSSSGSRWGIVIADVADKGIPAALYMALSKTLIRSLAIHHIDPGVTLGRVNQVLLHETRADLFVSVVYLVWEPGSGKVSLANAGHNPPLRFARGVPAQWLRTHGMVLGVEPDQDYQSEEIALQPGEVLLLYTDGVTEAFNGRGEVFGAHRLESLVLGLRDWAAQGIADAVIQRLMRFSGGDFSDDVTVVGLHRIGRQDGESSS